jgi:acyl-CoA synthetase (AMP-forming)/AMP-acid ligase II
MTIIDFLENNAKNYGDEECLVEINPQKKPESYRTWREYNLVEPGLAKEVRRSITWREFDDLANKTANLLLSKRIKKNDKVAILLMNC